MAPAQECRSWRRRALIFNARAREHQQVAGHGLGRLFIAREDMVCASAGSMLISNAHQHYHVGHACLHDIFQLITMFTGRQPPRQAGRRSAQSSTSPLARRDRPFTLLRLTLLPHKLHIAFS